MNYLYMVIVVILIMIINYLYYYSNIIKALWCITQALGSVLNVVIALIAFPLVYQFLLYSITMAIVISIFILVNKNYKYYNTTDGVCTKT